MDLCLKKLSLPNHVIIENRHLIVKKKLDTSRGVCRHGSNLTLPVGFAT